MSISKISIEQIKIKFQKELPTVHGPYKNLAAVEILIINNSTLDIILTKRSVFVQNHKNEIAFPGGAFESGDGDLLQTALRETCEEINIGSHSIEYLGNLEPYRTHYGLEIYPFLGTISEYAFMQATPNWEVEEIFTVPLGWFMDPENQEIHTIHTSDGILRRARYFRNYQGHIVWGITAEILNRLVTEIRNSAFGMRA